MHATTRNNTTTTAPRALIAGLALAVSGLMTGGPANASAVSEIPAVPHDALHRTARAERPHTIRGGIGDLLVRVRGGAFCSGTPITGTQYVVTAAHCVLDDAGRVAGRTVVRDGVTYTATAVLVDTRYVDEPSPELDAAVLVMEQPVPGPSASLGQSIPASGSVTLAGFQAIDSDGTLLRGHGPHDAPLPKNASGHLIEIASAPAGCVDDVAVVAVSPSRVDVPCGLIPGASGGGLFVAADGSVVLVGVVSTVAPDLSSNGVVPIDSVHELLSHSAQYLHSMSDVAVATGNAPRAVLS
jgi:hypothetical protein